MLPVPWRNKPLLPGLIPANWVWAESLLIPALALALSWLIQPQDPYGFARSFPWIWLAPLLIALRYGVLPGASSCAVLLLAWPLLGGGQAFPSAYFLGGGILTLIAGEYSGLWRTRMRRLEELNGYLDERIEQLSRRHHLLRLSHERLEQNLISKPVTLRDALAQLATLLKTDTGPGNLPAAQACLDFLAQIGQFESAAIFEYSGQALNPQAVAQLGWNAGDYHRDPLLVHACKLRRLCHVQTESLQDANTAFLLALPLVSGAGQLRGVLAVRQMPFFALNDDTLQMLAALGAYYAEQITVHEIAAPILEIMPDCPPDFAYETFKLQRVQRETGLSSAIVILTLRSGPLQNDLFNVIQKAQRSQDMIWPIQLGGHRILVTLMPLCSLSAVEGYLVRIEQLLSERFACDFHKARIETAQVDLGQPGGLLILQDLLRRNRA